jgi:hypothetical protein
LAAASLLQEAATLLVCDQVQITDTASMMAIETQSAGKDNISD